VIFVKRVVSAVFPFTAALVAAVAGAAVERLGRDVSSL